MGATAFQRMRREQEALAQQTPQEVDDTKVIESALRAKAKELGIKSYHLKSVETLEKEIGVLEGV